MKAYLLTLQIGLTLIITGCATQEHKFSAEGGCLTCFNNPFSGEPINHDGTANQNASSDQKISPVKTTQTNAIYKKYQVKFDVPVNVDVAFIKVKREFDFNSEDEVRTKWGANAEYRLHSESYKWSAIPSVSYSMGSDSDIDGYDIDIVTDIDKKTDQSSEITVSYSLGDSSINAETIGKTLKNRIIKALNL